MLRLLKFSALIVTIALPATVWCQQTDPSQKKQSVHGSQGGQSVPPSSSASQDDAKTTVVEGSPDATPAPADRFNRRGRAQGSRAEKGLLQASQSLHQRKYPHLGRHFFRGRGVLRSAR